MTKKQGAVFFGIVLGGATTSIFTLNKCGTPVESDPPPAVQPADTGSEKIPEPKPDPSKVATTPKPPDPDPKPVPTPDPNPKFTSPDALVSALVDKIREGDFDGFLEIAGPDAISPAIRPELKQLFDNPDLAPDPDNPIREIAKFGKDSTRWSIELKPKPGGASGVPAKTADDCANAFQCEDERAAITDPDQNCDNDTGEDSGSGGRQIHVDVVPDEKGGFKVSKVSLPGRPGMKSDVPGAPPGELPDALTVAHAFSNAIIDRDFELARSLTDPSRITDERVAALMIALEEGKFRLRERQPLVVTFSKEDLTWVLTRVDSSSNASEFALEMSLDNQAGWQINGLTFSKLIAALAEGAGAGGVAYAPIVTDPQGGDSLVLYFEFDEEKLSQRTAQQLEIVAQILKQDRSRRIHINGHADAMGTDSYNEALSNKRAAAVRSGLIEYGAAPEQVLTKAFGEAMPRRPNFNPDGTDNPGGRSQNRRAEVYLDF